MRTRNFLVALATVFICLASLFATQAVAGGFFVRQQSTSALSSAFAGASARGLDPSHMFFNPATIVDNQNTNITVDTRLFLPDADIEVTSATNLLGADVTSRGNSGSMVDPALAPGLFVSSALSDDVFFGIGVSAPFAVVIESNASWAGQYQLVKTDMTALNVNPVLAWKAAPWLAISGGLQLQTFDVDLRKTEFPLAPFLFTESLGFLKGEDVSFGVTAGLLVEPMEGLRLGVGYRSQVKHRLHGTAGVKLPSLPNDTASFTVKLPQVVSLGIEKRIAPRVTLLAEAQWVDWSVFQGFRIDFGSGRPTEVRPQDWRDTWFFSGGVRVILNERTSATAGVSYDQGISKGSGGNTLSPDGNRTAVSVGVTRSISPRTTLRLSYTHMFIDDAPIRTSNVSGTLNANFESSLDVIGLSLTFQR